MRPLTLVNRLIVAVGRLQVIVDFEAFAAVCFDAFGSCLVAAMPWERRFSALSCR